LWILKKYHPSENLKFNNLGIFQSLKLRNLMGKNPLKNFILEDLFSSVLSQFKKYYPFGNLKLNNFGIF